MRELIARSEIPQLREACPRYSVHVVPGLAVTGRPYAIMLFHPTLMELADEVIAAEGRGVRIIASVEPYRRLLFEALYPDVLIIDDSEMVSLPDLIDGFRGRKRIRFTDLEKRTLDELPYGLCSKELSKRLGISERSVRRTKQKLMMKTGLLSSEQLLIYALVQGEISTRSSSRSVDRG